VIKPTARTMLSTAHTISFHQDAFHQGAFQRTKIGQRMRR
jgi:hypothetical protein